MSLNEIKNKKRVKYIYNVDDYDINTEINEWLDKNENINLIDIKIIGKYSGGGGSYNSTHKSVLIIYEQFDKFN